jgi:hypothetical protein
LSSGFFILAIEWIIDMGEELQAIQQKYAKKHSVLQPKNSEKKCIANTKENKSKILFSYLLIRRKKQAETSRFLQNSLDLIKQYGKLV